MTGRTIPGQPGEDEYNYTQGQRGYSIEGRSRLGDLRVQHSSSRPDPDSSHSIPQPTVRPRHDYTHNRPKGIPLIPYSSSSRHPADRVDRSSQRRDEEDSSDDSCSNDGSGSETAAPSPRSRRGIRSRGDYKTRSKAPSVLTRPPLDNDHGSSDSSDLSKLKSQQPWVAEPSGYKEKESAQLPAHLTSSRQDPRGREESSCAFLPLFHPVSFLANCLEQCNFHHINIKDTLLPRVLCIPYATFFFLPLLHIHRFVDSTPPCRYSCSPFNTLFSRQFLFFAFFRC